MIADQLTKTDAQLSELGQDDANSLAKRYFDHESKLEKLTQAAATLQENNLPFAEVTQKIASLQETYDSEEAENYITARLCILGTMKTLGTLKTASAQQAESQEVVAEAASKEILPDAVSVKYVKKDSTSYVKLGRRQIRLSAPRSTSQRDYAAERLAAVVAFVEQPDKVFDSYEVWGSIQTRLGLGSEVEFDKNALFQVRKFVTETCLYRNKPLVVHNHKRGVASRYFLNPELRGQFDLQISEQDFKDITTTSTPPTERTRPSTIDIFEEAVSQEQEGEQKSLTRTELLSRNILRGMTVPTEQYYYLFTATIHSLKDVANAYIDQIENGRDFNQLRRLFIEAQSLMEDLERRYPSIEDSKDERGARTLRGSMFKAINWMANDEDMLNALLDQSDKLDPIVMQFVENFIDMQPYELKELENILSGQAGIRVEQYSGSFTAGEQILGATAIGQIDGHLVERPIGETVETEPAESQPENMSVAVEPEPKQAESEELIIDQPQTAERAKRRSKALSLDQEQGLRKRIGEVLETCEQRGMLYEVSGGRVRAVFKLGTSGRAIKNASERNIISEERQSLSLIDIVRLVTDHELKWGSLSHVQRKAAEKLIKTCVAQFEAKKKD